LEPPDVRAKVVAEAEESPQRAERAAERVGAAGRAGQEAEGRERASAFPS
jgi:hypothetical protein